MKIVVIDGAGGGVGRALVEGLKKNACEAEIIAIGLNAAATAAMLRAGADAAATGENPVRVAVRDADIVLGPIGIGFADAMLGEVTPACALAVARSRALKVLIPVGRCGVRVAGTSALPMSDVIEDAVRQVCACARNGLIS